MANAKREEPPPQPPVKIVLEMTEDEAEIVCVMAGAVRARYDSNSQQSWQTIDSIWRALDDALPNRTRSWGDFFESTYPLLRKELP